MKVSLLLFITWLAGAGAAPATAASVAAVVPVSHPAAPTAVDHSAYDRLLKKYVSAKGFVNYKGLKADEAAFNQYLAQISKNPPAANASKPEQMAFWINAYNAFTLRLILDHYPLKSIKDIGSKIKIPLVNTPWAVRFFSIGSERMSLDNIEHGILRKKFDDPRVHFALVCASISCPALRNEAYTAAKLESQLDDQGHDFLNNPAKNNISKSNAQLSRYFEWYRSDWTSNKQSVVSWVNKYSVTKIDAKTPISYLEYNWNLNEQ
jgi:hypothetical protein